MATDERGEGVMLFDHIYLSSLDYATENNKEEGVAAKMCSSQNGL